MMRNCSKIRICRSKIQKLWMIYCKT